MQKWLCKWNGREREGEKKNGKRCDSDTFVMNMRNFQSKHHFQHVDIEQRIFFSFTCLIRCAIISIEIAMCAEWYAMLITTTIIIENDDYLSYTKDNNNNSSNNNNKKEYHGSFCYIKLPERAWESECVSVRMFFIIFGGSSRGTSAVSQMEWIVYAYCIIWQNQ